MLEPINKTESTESIRYLCWIVTHRVTSFLDAEGRWPSIGCRPVHVEIYLHEGNQGRDVVYYV